VIQRIDHPDFEKRRERRRKRRLRTISMLPTLLTLGNLYFGFAAIYCCCREAQDMGNPQVNANTVRTLNSDFLEAKAPSFISVAFWMLIGSMICDAFDGRVARKTGQASKFGEQLDSLADAVSFGVAPALMMIMLVRREFITNDWISTSEFARHYAQLAVFFGAIYACCAALRLARFNVETSLDEAAHRGFKGLPSPGAAAGLASLVFLHDYLDIRVGLDAAAMVLLWVAPLLTVALALLMVSRVPYVHFISSVLRRRPFGHVVIALVIILLVVKYTELAFTLGAWAFVLSGPIRLLWLWRSGWGGLPRMPPVSTSTPPETAIHE
jgi:CDP-diacylglycerol---serine O-phosphatidyltransferase